MLSSINPPPRNGRRLRQLQPGALQTTFGDAQTVEDHANADVPDVAADDALGKSSAHLHLDTVGWSIALCFVHATHLLLMLRSVAHVVLQCLCTLLPLCAVNTHAQKSIDHRQPLHA